MSKPFNAKSKVILFECCLVGLIAVGALTLGMKTNSQQMKVLNQKDKGGLLKQGSKNFCIFCIMKEIL